MATSYNIGGQVAPDYHERYYFGGWVDASHGIDSKVAMIPDIYKDNYAAGYSDGLSERAILDPAT